jgi:hypothetical protein
VSIRKSYRMAPEGGRRWNGMFGTFAHRASGVEAALRLPNSVPS